MKLTRKNVSVSEFRPTGLTEVTVKDEEGDDVGRHTEDLGHQHDPVPGANGQGHHQQLRDDQRGEGDGHDVDELPLKEVQGAVHDDAPLERADQDPEEEHLEGQLPSLARRGGRQTSMHTSTSVKGPL